MRADASRSPIKSASLLALAVLIAFGVLFWAPIIYDDRWYLMANPLVNGPWPGLSAFFTGSFGDQGDYGPLITLGHWLLYRLFGAAPFPYRATSLLLHAAVAALVLRAARRRGVRGDVAFCAALLFALFPSHSEVLAQTSFKKHQLIALFGLLMLEVRSRWKEGSSRRTALSAALFIPALLCRESALMLVLLMAADAATVPQGARAGLRRDAPTLGVLAALAALYAILHILLLPRALTGPMGGNLPTHFLTAAKILLWHLGQLAAPVTQCQEHSLAPASLSRAADWGAALLLAALAAAAWRLASRDRSAAFGLAWILIFLFPFLNLLPYLNFSLVANRYHYMASIGFLLFIARLVSRLDPAPQPLAAAACAPDNPRAHAGLGSALRAEERFEEARAEFIRATTLDPNFSEPYVDLTWVNAKLGRNEEALAAARRRLDLRGDAAGWANLGTLEMSLGRFSDACPKLAQAFALDPGPEAAFGLGQCRAETGRWEEAEANLRLAAAHPNFRAPALAELAALFVRRGRRDD